jgi:uncharacterized protein DUF6624
LKKFILLLFFLTVFMTSKAQTFEAFVKKADSSRIAKDYRTAKDFYKKAFDAYPKTDKGYYNAACIAALSGDKKQSFAWLEKALAKGFDNIHHLKNDSDFESLHNDKRWKRIISKLQKEADKREANFDKPLQKELIGIFFADQSGRLQLINAQKTHGHNSKAVDSLWRIINVKDSINLIKVVKILDEKGWVGKDKIGQQANQTLFLVIQHSNLETQQKYLPMMRLAVKKGNADDASLALLEDRVALGEGRKQIYGSQIGTDPETNKQFVLPLEDPDNVDKRRAAVGLGPLSEYVKTWDIVWDVEAYKKQTKGK